MDRTNEVNADLLQRIPANAKIIIEFGCGTGATGAEYKRINPNCLYIGIEQNVADGADRAKIAEEKLDVAIATDLDSLDLSTTEITAGTVDCILFNDIFPHIINPWEMLKQSANWLKPDGQVLANIPNTQHWHRIVKLLRGEWDAGGSAISDTRRGSAPVPAPVPAPESAVPAPESAVPAPESAVPAPVPAPESAVPAPESAVPAPESAIAHDPSSLPLRFFTLESLKKLFSQAGLNIYEIQTKGQSTGEFQQFQEIMAPALKGLGIKPTTFATQTKATEYIVRATKSSVQPRRLLIQTILMAPTACDRVRVLEPDRLSATIPGVRTVSSVKSADLNVPLPGEEKVFIWQRTIMNYPGFLPKLKELLQRGYLIVSEIDDDPLRRPEYGQNQFLSYRGCHCVQTSTEPLAEYLRQHNPHVALFQNQLAYLPSPRTYSQDNSLTIFFGALNRQADWQPVMPALNRILAQHSQKVRVKVLHDRQFFDALTIPNKEFEPFSPYERYQEILHTADIALLPLEFNRVNSMKSDLKFIECAGHGAAVLASPTVYERSIIDGETGLIYRSLEEFETKLQELIHNSQLRQQLARNAYEWVAENRLLSQHYQQRRDWYCQMRDRLPELNQELRDRVPELFGY